MSHSQQQAPPGRTDAMDPGPGHGGEPHRGPGRLVGGTPVL